MITKRNYLIILSMVILLTIAAGAWVNGTGWASSTLQGVNPDDVTTLPYSGYLVGEDGQAVTDGTYDLNFAVYDAQNGGTLIWSGTQEDVPVHEGTFISMLTGLDISVVRDLWLEIDVRGPEETAFTHLSPRQSLNTIIPDSPASITAGAACAHDHFGESWYWGTNADTGLDLHGSVPWSNALVKVTNQKNGPAVWAVNTGGGNALRGEGYGSSIGVYGESADGSGVFGRSANSFGLGAAGGGDGSLSDPAGDLVLEGDRGEIIGEYLALESNLDIAMYLDHDNNTPNEWFRIFNGNGNDVFHITQAGDMVAAGSKAGYVADVAQNNDSVSLETGDVVIISGAGPALVGEIPVIKVRLASDAETGAIIGVVDKRFVPASEHDAGVDSNEAEADDTIIAPGEYLTIVTLGSFKAIKVDASYGAIMPGDLLVASSNPGYAMRATSPAAGTIIGKALGTLETGTGVIAVIVTMQ